jgi:predicted permease
MHRIRALIYRLRGLFHRRLLEAEMQEELRTHLDALIERNVAAGMSGVDARKAAQREFGGVAQIAERARDQRRSLWIEQIGRDLRYAVRSLGKSPSFTVTAIVTLALGIGVNAALFSVINMVALRPLPVKNPEDLVTLRGYAKDGFPSNFGYEEYLEYRNGNRTLDGLIAFTGARWSFENEKAPDSDPTFAGRAVPFTLVSDNYFDMLGGAIQRGRGFQPEDTKRGAAPVIVLSNVFWETRLQRDPDVVGRTLLLNHQPVTVIGVAAPVFSGEQPMPPAGWLPLAQWSNRPADYESGGPLAFGLIGRLKPGITVEQAKGDLDTIAARRSLRFPSKHVKVFVHLERGLHFLNLGLSSKSATFLGFVFFGFALVLVIACTNVANLLLARGVARQPEIGVRLMLGASRGRIIRQLLTENLLLCVLGAILGLALATWTLQLLLPVVVSRLPTEWALETRHLAFFQTMPDHRVLGFTALLTLGATLSAGLLPALHASGANLFSSLRNEVAFVPRLTPARLRQLLVITQVAISLTLLSSAGILVRNLMTHQKIEVGFDAPKVFSVTMRPNPAITDENAALRQALETLRGIPGVAASCVADPGPLFGYLNTRIRLAGSSPDKGVQQVMTSVISDGYFDTFGVALRRGRGFRETELNSSAQVVVISETLANQLWPGQDAVGQLLAVSDAHWLGEHSASTDTFRDCEVIGVAGDIFMDASHDERRLLYLPFARDVAKGGSVFVRPREISAAALIQIVRAAKAGGIELQFQRPHSFWVGFFALPFYAFAIASGTLGALALGMASVGLYGLMSFSVNRRVHEIGVRMAMGASEEKVVGLFVRQGLRLVGLGLVLGLIGGMLFAQLMSKILNGFVGAFDPLAFTFVTLMFAVIACLACWLPARRAAQVDPMVALRAE